MSSLCEVNYDRLRIDNALGNFRKFDNKNKNDICRAWGPFLGPKLLVFVICELNEQLHTGAVILLKQHCQKFILILSVHLINFKWYKTLWLELSLALLVQ